MKKLSKTSEFLWVLGTVFLALGVSLCSKADLGVSMIAAPSFVISEALGGDVPFLTTGVTGYLIQGVLLALLCVVIRRFNWRFLLAFASGVIYGYVLDLFLWLWGDINFSSVALRWVMLFAGNTLSAFGIACFFRTYLPLQVFELFVSEVSKKFSLTVVKTKWCFDLSLLAVSVALALVLFGDGMDFDWTSIYRGSFHSVGLGTIVTAFMNSPMIALSGKLIDKVTDSSPRLEKMASLLEIKE